MQQVFRLEIDASGLALRHPDFASLGYKRLGNLAVKLLRNGLALAGRASPLAELERGWIAQSERAKSSLNFRNF